MRAWRTAAIAVTVLAVALVVLVLVDDGGEEGSEPSQPAAETAPIPVEPGGGIGDGAPAPPQPEQEDEASGPSRAERERRAMRAAGRAYRRYVAAIDARDGATICESIAPGFERELKPPADAGGCAERISASIGFEDPRGFPVWEETILSGIEKIALDDRRRQARVTASIVTRFRDREQPSVESDIAYLERRGGGWRLLKPSGALWRAVGKPEPPPTVIVPPPGFEA